MSVRTQEPTGPQELPRGFKPLETHPTMAIAPVRVWLIDPDTKTVMVRDTECHVHGESTQGSVHGPWVLSAFWYFGKCCCECDPLDFKSWIPEVDVVRDNGHGGVESVEILTLDQTKGVKWASLTCDGYPMPIMAAVRGEHAALFQPVADDVDDWHEIAVGLLGQPYTKVLMRASRRSW